MSEAITDWILMKKKYSKNVVIEKVDRTDEF